MIFEAPDGLVSLFRLRINRKWGIGGGGGGGSGGFSKRINGRVQQRR
jgi:hypothetical protein